jgi:serine/threonine protein kinase
VDDQPTVADSLGRPLPTELANHPDYEIVRELGGGAMGVLYLAHNRLMGRNEVLKLIAPDVTEKPGIRDRFLREIRAVARLRHPNIVTAYAAFRIGDSLVFAMEYAEGLDLGRVVAAKGPLPVRRACAFIHQAALGLQHAHQAGLVHRDIKPGNLMLTQKGGKPCIKVLDFGLAKAEREQGTLELARTSSSKWDSSASGFLSMAGQTLGTPEFIAPEQISDAQRADIRADIYSLGCTLYYLLSGRPPFEGTSLLGILQAHYTTEAMPLDHVRTDVPAALAQLVARMMAKAPEHRLQTPLDVSKALAPFFQKQAIGRDAPDLGEDQAKLAEVDLGLIITTESAAGLAFGSGSLVGPAPGDWLSLVKLDDTEGDGDELPAPVPTRRKRSLVVWLALAVLVGITAVILGVASILGLNPFTRPPS